MINDTLLGAFDEQAACMYQPSLREPTHDDFNAVQDGVVLVCGGTLKPQPIEWIWTYWLAMGKLHILAGAPGQGKTTIALALAATLTVGGSWPDGTRCEVGNVLIWSGEDDPADTLLPRMLAMGADCNRVHFVTGARIGGQLMTFDPARDLRQLELAIEKIGGISLLIVDPIVSAVGGDSHKNTEVRRALQPLVDLAASCSCAVLGISHFSKGGQGQDPTQRVVGSVAFSAVARVVLVAAKVNSNDGTDRRILARSKSNIGPDDGGFEYQIEQSEPLPGIQASYIAWGAAVAGTARELLTEPDDGAYVSNDANDAMEMLRRELVCDGWTSEKTATKPLKDAGFTKKQIWRASKKLNVMRIKGGMKEGWLWRLPEVSDPPLRMKTTEDSAEGSEGSSILNRESSEPSQEMESSVEVEIL